MSEAKVEPEYRRPALLFALAPALVLVLLLSVNVLLYGADATYGPNQIALILAAAFAAVGGLSLKVPMKKMLGGITTSLNAALPAILILLLIGALSGTWMLSGIVPAMIYYGLNVLEPSYFLMASVVICSIVSVATGSSWSTVATVGVALMGIGTALEAPQAMTAGAIISGAYFGDKLSPLSDTTNLAAAMAGTDLITHIRYMLWTTVPSILITLGLFWYLGTTLDTSGANPADVSALQAVLASRFNITPWLFIVPVVVLVLVFMKVDAVAALFVGTLLGAAVAIVAQPAIIHSLVGDQDQPAEARSILQLSTDSYRASVKAMMGKLEGAVDFSGIKLSETEETAKEAGDDKQALMDALTPAEKANVFAKKLLSSKGMAGMMNTIWLIICAMCFGGVMEACGMLKRITDALIQFARSTGSLIATTVSTCLFLNLTASDQYLAIVVPGRMFRQTYKDRGLAPQNLSRTLEDSGTVTSVLVPWNTCGAAQMAVLHLTSYAYIGFCFFNYLSPMMTVIFGFTGIAIAKLATKDDGSKT